MNGVFELTSRNELGELGHESEFSDVSQEEQHSRVLRGQDLPFEHTPNLRGLWAVPEVMFLQKSEDSNTHFAYFFLLKI